MQNSSEIRLHEAVRTGNKDTVKQLLALGADVNSRTEKDTTVLYEAAFRGHKEIVELLLAHGASVNDYITDGDSIFIHTEEKTALYRAAREGHKEIVELLLAHGAWLDSRGRKSESTTALYQAARGGHKEIVKILLAHGASGASVHSLAEYCGFFGFYRTVLLEAVEERHKRPFRKFSKAYCGWL